MSSIIFDFDGTIADSFETFLNIMYKITGTTERLTKAQETRLRSMSPRHVAAEVHIPLWKVPFLVLKARPQLRKAMRHVEPFAGMPEVIKQLSINGHQLYIMSSNSVQNIQPFLEKYDMSTEFIKIYGNVGVFAKARVLKRALRQNKLLADQTYYIGDEVRDVVAAQHAGLQMIAVAWGYNSAKILAEHQPSQLVDTPADILKLF